MKVSDDVFCFVTGHFQILRWDLAHEVIILLFLTSLPTFYVLFSGRYLCCKFSEEFINRSILWH